MTVTLARRASSNPLKSDFGRSNRGFTRCPVNPDLLVINVNVVLIIKAFSSFWSPCNPVVIGEEELSVFLSALLAHLPPHLVHVRMVAGIYILIWQNHIQCWTHVQCISTNDKFKSYRNLGPLSPVQEVGSFTEISRLDCHNVDSKFCQLKSQHLMR